MMRATFLSNSGGRVNAVVGHVELLDDGSLAVDGPEWLRRVAREPAGLHIMGPLVEPSSGEAFMRALAYQYSGIYLRVVLEDESGEPVRLLEDER